MTVKQVIISPRTANKTIVICVDEGVRDPENGRHYARGESSVVRLHDSILRDSQKQLSIYIPGRSSSEIATNSFSPTALVELTGEAYASLIGTWIPGDRIVLVGAGRGGSVCVELARLVAKHGIPERATVWKDQTGRISYVQMSECVYKKDGAQHSTGGESIELVALLDPLAELVFPSPYAAGAAGTRVNLLSSMVAPVNVASIISLLAIDDHRTFFEPLVFESSSAVSEIWVPGMHEAVVGTSRDRLISDTSLSLLVRVLKDKGVEFYPVALEDISENKDGYGVLSCEDQGMMIVRRDRVIRSNQGQPGKRGVPSPAVHVSAVTRAARQQEYRPSSVAALDGDYSTSSV